MTILYILALLPLIIALLMILRTACEYAPEAVVGFFSSIILFLFLALFIYGLAGLMKL